MYAEKTLRIKFQEAHKQIKVVTKLFSEGHIFVTVIFEFEKSIVILTILKTNFSESFNNIYSCSISLI